jgi:hypothetical protein
VSGERVVRLRLAAILAADVAGYSRLMGRMKKARSNASKRCAASSSIRKLPSTTAASSKLPATACYKSGGENNPTRR